MIENDEMKEFYGIVYGTIHGSDGGYASILLQGISLISFLSLSDQDKELLVNDEVSTRTIFGIIYGTINGSDGGYASILVQGNALINLLSLY